MTPAKPIHFTGLNGLRGIGSVIVVACHLEQAKHLLGLPNHIGALGQIGEQSMNMFFCMSAFLISHIILADKEAGAFTIRRFYLRRALRILPLYYLMILVAFVALPLACSYLPLPGRVGELLRSLVAGVDAHQAPLVSLYVFLMPQFALFGFPIVFGVSQSWSLGYEEHFYLLWPLIMALGPRLLWSSLFGLVILKQAATFQLHGSIGIVSAGAPDELPLLRYLNFFPIEHFLTGCLAAWLFFHRRSWTDRCFSNKWLQYAAGPMNLALLLVPMTHGPMRCVQAVLQAFALLCLVYSGVRYLNLENRTLTMVGKVSYGVYMTHPIVILVLLALVERAGLLDRLHEWPYGVGLHVVVLACTLAVGWLCYRYFEKFFLKLRN